MLYLLFRSTLTTAWEGLSKRIWLSWTQKICSNSAVNPWWRNLNSQKATHVRFFSFRNIYNLRVKCGLWQEEHKYETDVQSIWHGNSSLYNSLIQRYKDVTVSIAQVCYQCGNIRRVFKSPEPERRPSLMPETRIWVSFRSPDHTVHKGVPKTLFCWILQCPLDHSCQMVNKCTTESLKFIDPQTKIRQHFLVLQ